MTWVRDDVIGRYLDRMFVHSFIEERFAASASRCVEASYELKTDTTTAFVFTQTMWRHPQTR